MFWQREWVAHLCSPPIQGIIMFSRLQQGMACRVSALFRTFTTLQEALLTSWTWRVYLINGRGQQLGEYDEMHANGLMAWGNRKRGEWETYEGLSRLSNPAGAVPSRCVCCGIVSHTFAEIYEKQLKLARKVLVCNAMIIIMYLSRIETCDISPLTTPDSSHFHQSTDRPYFVPLFLHIIYVYIANTIVIIKALPPP